MTTRIGLVGFVNSEEILADTIKQQTPGVIVDGYEVIPNEAFGRSVDNRYPLYGVDEKGEFGFMHLDRVRQIPKLGYGAVNLGPIPAAFIAGEMLDATGYDYIGPRRNELGYEMDKTKISEIFPDSSNVLPPTVILETVDLSKVVDIVEQFEGNAVFKFVGEYPKYYQDSETRRVRLLSEFSDSNELLEFITHSIDASGKVVVQKFIEGQQFSFTCLVDGNDGIFSLGENICYKNRFDNDEGPLCDGTGAVSVNNSVPELLTHTDIEAIKADVVTPYVNHLAAAFGRSPKTFLNLDLIKDLSGKVYLLEVNHREPGGHTLANLLNGLETPLAEALQATQEGRLTELQPRYKLGASVVVSAYPRNFPYPFESDEARPIVNIPKLRPHDDVRIYTGWVDVLSETDDSVTARTQLSPTMLFTNHARSLAEARKNVYDRIAEVVPDELGYRTDIGKRRKK